MRFAGLFKFEDRIPTYNGGGLQRIDEVQRDRNKRDKPMMPFEKDIASEPGSQERRLKRLKSAGMWTGR